MKSRNFIYLVVALLALLFGAHQVMSAQALSSLLPEAEAAESSITMQKVIQNFDFANSAEECNVPAYLDELPDRVLFDNDGNRHGIDEFRDIANTIQCVIFVDDQGNEAPIGSAEIGQVDFVGVVGGESFTFSNGRLVDATKQSVRATFISGVSGRMSLFLAGIEVVGLSGDDPCQEIGDIALEGETVELRYAAFDSLYDNLFFALDQSCFEPLVEDEDILLDAAAAGSFEAALTLVLDWQIEALTEVFILENNLFGLLDFVDAELDRFEDVIRVNREEAPLVALAASFCALEMSLQISSPMLSFPE